MIFKRNAADGFDEARRLIQDFSPKEQGVGVGNLKFKNYHSHAPDVHSYHIDGSRVVMNPPQPVQDFMQAELSDVSQISPSWLFSSRATDS